MTDADGLAQSLLAARAGGLAVPARKIDTATAYAVQAQVAAAFGPVGGWKYAARPGSPAIMGPIQAADILPSGTRFDAKGQPAGIELEVGFRLNDDPPPVDALDFEERLRALVTPLVAIELVQTRLDTTAQGDALMKLADHQLNGGLVSGDLADWDGGPISEVTARLSLGGDMAVDGPVALPFGEAFACLVGLLRLVGTHCGGVRAGHLVITGSLNGVPWVTPPAKIRGTIEGIGSVAVDLA